MTITPRALNRATLARQLLLERQPITVTDAMRNIVALQAQQAESPYIALWNRLAGFDGSALDEAFTNHDLVKATLMRLTLHAVHGEEYRIFREAMEPTLRAARLNELRQHANLDAAEADALIAGLLDHAGTPRTSAEIKAWLEEQTGTPPDPFVMSRIRGYAPLVHAPTHQHWSFGPHPSHVAAPAQPALTDPDAPAHGLQALVLRYLEGFGPATIPDIAQFALVQRARVKDAIAALGNQVVQLEGTGKPPLFDIPGGLLPDEEMPAPPRLMAMWDSVLLAYHDRSRVIPPEYRKMLIRNNGDVLPGLLVDGYIAGVWRTVEGGIEATAFHPLPDEVWEQLGAEARELASFLAGRSTPIYTRYNRWWEKLPTEAERRMLAELPRGT